MADKLNTEERKLIEENCLPEQVRLRNLDGCEHCYKGVTGRTVIAEVVSPDARFFSCIVSPGVWKQNHTGTMNLEELPVISTYYT